MRSMVSSSSSIISALAIWITTGRMSCTVWILGTIYRNTSSICTSSIIISTIFINSASLFAFSISIANSTTIAISIRCTRSTDTSSVVSVTDRTITIGAISICSAFTMFAFSRSNMTKFISRTESCLICSCARNLFASSWCWITLMIACCTAIRKMLLSRLNYYCRSNFHQQNNLHPLHNLHLGNKSM